MLPEPLDQISNCHDPNSETAEGVFDTRKYYNAVADAVVLPCKAAMARKPGFADALARSEALWATK